VRSFAAAAFPTPAESENGASNVNAAFLSRFLFVLGEVGLRHLVHVEGLARAVRRARVDRDRKAAESAEAAAAKGDDNSEEAALAAALGQGSVSEDLHLDNSRELAETELLAFKAAKGVGKGIVAAYAPVVVALCGHPAVAEGHALLRGAALAALSRLMAIDGVFCEEHLALIFTRLRRESDRGTRAALMVALGDLAFRFPNAVEPWTQHLYGVREWGNSLHDSDAGVRQHAVTVLAHLVLNDMMKVKGHIAEMARCLEDPDPRVASVARLLFHELSRKHGNPIYNLLPDLLSRLSGDDQLTPDVFQKIMTRLLGFIDKDRQTESLADKFTNRFAEAALASTPKPARDVAFCLSQLSLSDKAFKKFMDGWKMYEPALYDKEVYAALNGVVAKAKKSYGGKKAFAKNACETDAAGDVSALEGPRKEIEDFERRMAAAHVERFESYRSARRAEGHAVDEDETPAVTLGGGEERSGKEGPRVCRGASGRRRRGRTPRRAAAVRRRAAAAAAADDDAPSAPKALAEEEARAEAEAENDENAPGENAPDAGAPEESAPEENAPEPAPKRGRKPAAKKEKKAKPAAKKTQEETDAPVRSSRRALRAK
jgi:condensin complex subunit 1